MQISAEESPLLGLCVIVRDAEATIRQLLESVRDHFDEIVIVDTGSTDKTRIVIEDFFALSREGEWHRPRIYWSAGKGFPKMTLARFEWRDDFSAARNFAFDLSTAKWRMYLDADDILEDGARLVTQLERTEANSPDSNCISLKYEYVENELPQDVIRCVRWADGWRWEDPLHEHLVPCGHPRRISKYADLWVRHRPKEGHANLAFARNVRIASAAYANAVSQEKRGLWAYYLADYAAEFSTRESVEEARAFYREAADSLGVSNLACQALTRWARMEIREGNIEGALKLAGEATAKAPELPDAWATLGVCFALLNQPQRADLIFTSAEGMPPVILESVHDSVFLDGIARVHAARSALRLGRVEDAEKRLASVPVPLQRHPAVRVEFFAMHRELMQTRGLQALKTMVDFFVWDTQPTNALELLKHAPAAISHLPQVAAWKRDLKKKLPHVRGGWRGYKETYASIPAEDFHTNAAHVEGVKNLGRTKAVVEWARNGALEQLDANDGSMKLRVLSIGAQDCIIEAAVMRANPYIHMTVCDVAPQAAKGIQKLIEEFPDRVKTHTIEINHYDWYGAGGDDYDAIFMFEVLEHLPDPLEALALLASSLAKDGVLFFSTPLAEAWVEPYLTGPEGPAWYGHLHAFNPPGLLELCTKAGLTGDLFTTDGDSIFLGRMGKAVSQKGE